MNEQYVVIVNPQRKIIVFGNPKDVYKVHEDKQLSIANSFNSETEMMNFVEEIEDLYDDYSLFQIVKRK